ncbi:hypothetical protein OSB04_019785 [Centaurea solstitialis]|uniref:Retroviral polymerase SH3-like domain-containing protein n=1 Tax=Centaurea solstitialis TaxID=347529 RepID=A0AA38T9G0_9ASTR|nr:hypothetical protein OSB04_019785 [Centaurea solstitialis]
MIARPMTMKSKLPVYAWGQAILHAATLIRIRPSSYNASSPLKMVFGQEPNISHLRIFGCAVYVPIAPPQRTKMEPQRRLGIYVGYESASIIKYLEPLTGDLFTARFADCHFDESEFPALGGGTKQPENQKVQKTIHLQGLANQLPDTFTDPKRVTKSHIPAANAPIKLNVPEGQDNMSNEFRARQKRGRPLGYKDKNPRKKKGANNQDGHIEVNETPRVSPEETLDMLVLEEPQATKPRHQYGGGGRLVIRNQHRNHLKPQSRWWMAVYSAATAATAACLLTSRTVSNGGGDDSFVTTIHNHQRGGDPWPDHIDAKAKPPAWWWRRFHDHQSQTTSRGGGGDFTITKPNHQRGGGGEYAITKPKTTSVVVAAISRSPNQKPTTVVVVVAPDGDHHCLWTAEMMAAIDCCFNHRPHHTRWLRQRCSVFSDSTLHDGDGGGRWPPVGGIGRRHQADHRWLPHGHAKRWQLTIETETTRSHHGDGGVRCR